MRYLFLASLLLLPLAAHAHDDCEFQAPRDMKLDLSGVKSVQVEVRSHELHVTGGAAAKTAQITGRACASDKKFIDELTISQRREGDVLVVTLGAEHSGINLSWSGHSHYELQVNLAMPSNVPLSVNVGSGDAWVDGMGQLDARVGSGDLHINNISGRVSASIGSGDIDARDIGSLELGAVGSGDFKASGIKGDVRVGSVGSGDVELRDVKGSVRADTLGSGDLTVKGVGGDLYLGAKGSGDVNYSGVTGKVNVPRDND